MIEPLSDSKLKFYGRMKTWTIDEAACLLARVDPASASRARSSSYVELEEQLFSLIANLMCRELYDGVEIDPTDDPFPAAELLDLADMLGIKCDPSLGEVVEQTNEKRAAREHSDATPDTEESGNVH
ncbi:MAG: hypothetical protein AAGH41_05180 [Pseudomonadota bacterium]